jgi:dihydropteroate synthase
MSEAPATILRLRGDLVRIEPGRPLLMGVVNASPESFFDGARHPGLDAQLAHARWLVAAGAALVDVGGQSGVTHRPPVPVAEELRRVLPLVERLAAEGVAVSIDTWSARVARAALTAGAAMVNDPSGLSDPDVAAACAETGAALVLTHTRTAPKRKEFPRYGDVTRDVVAFLRARMAATLAVGVEAEQLVVDPGPDLSKTPAETVAVLRSLERVRALGRPLLLAVSRKDFVGALTGRPPRGRLAGTLAAVGEGVDAGAAIVRCHDVEAVADFLAVRAALRGDGEVTANLRLDARLRREESAA